MRKCESASIGIGAMITFIALLLVAATLSATIILMMEKGFKEQTNTADKSQGRGQIVIESIFIYRFEPCWQSTSTDPDCNFPGVASGPYGNHQLLLFFHLGPGSETITDTDTHYLIHCLNEEGGNYEVSKSLRGSDFDDSSAPRATGATMNNVNDPPLEAGHAVLQSDHSTRAQTFIPNEKYLIMLEMYDTQNTGTNADDEGCRITESYDTQLILTITGGSSTQATLHFRSLEPGQLVI